MNNKLPTAKLKISDHLNGYGIPCKPDCTNMQMLNYIALHVGYGLRLNTFQSKTISVICQLADGLDVEGEITYVAFASHFTKPNKKNTKKKKGKFKCQDQEWRRVRYFVLKRDGGRCCLCGRRAKDGVRLHVDHIIPKSIRPDLGYETENLQVLCDDCNIGKSNKDDTDWR